MKTVWIAALLVAIAGSTALAQNQILIVSTDAAQLENPAALGQIVASLDLRPSYASRIETSVSVGSYSAILLAGCAAGPVPNLSAYIAEGGLLIVSGAVPYCLMTQSTLPDSVFSYLGFQAYTNGSGNLVASIPLDQIGVPKDSLLDRTACGIGFGGLSNGRASAEVLAEWFCPAGGAVTAAITHNRYGRGQTFYFSRLLSTARVRDLVAWALGSGIEYRWGDADGSGRVNVSDAVFLVHFVFDNGAAHAKPAAGDANGDAHVNLSDAVYLINYVFNGGPAPRAGLVR